MMAAADPSCPFNSQCFCRWRSCCSPRIPRVAPGRDYECMPAGADDSPAWSLLVGFISISAGNSNSLRLHRFHVARSGRVLGRSGDALEILADGVDHEGKDAASQTWAVVATPSPDGRSTCLFSKVVPLADLRRNPPLRPLRLHPSLDAGGGVTVSPLPALPDRHPIRPISAAGDLWAPYLSEEFGPSCPSRLVMLRLDSGAGEWVEAAAIDLPHGRQMPEGVMRSGRTLQGYAVVGRTILLSLQPSHLFFAFDCSARAWAAVATAETKHARFKHSETQHTHYVPISDRGVYVEEDDTIYFLSGSFVNAYKLCRDHGQGQYRMAPPTRVDRVCPFGPDDGYGFLTHLGGRLMCSVWISVSLRCNCDALHVLITTFRVKGNNGSNREPFVPSGLKIIHSTCRRLDMLPNRPRESDSEFCFLQEFHDGSEMPLAKKKRETPMAPSTLLQVMEVATSSSVEESSKMRACCRKFLNELPYSTAIMLEGSAIQTNKTLYIICQLASCSAVYKITILDGRLPCHDKTLKPLCTMDTFICDDDEYELMNRPAPPWHFVCNTEYIYAVPRIKNEIYEYSLNHGTVDLVPAKRPDGAKLSIALVLQVGGTTIGISDTLQGVYHLHHRHGWKYRGTYGSFDIEKKVDLRGYVVLSNDSFMVYDGNTNCCFLLDLQMDRWSVVLPFVELTRSLEQQTEPLQRRCWGGGFLSGRSVLVEGFIYTCGDGGLAACELIEDGESWFLGDQIDLQFPWRKYWERDQMCFDYVGRDAISGNIMFCVVQGHNNDYDPHHGVPMRITTVQVRTERTQDGKLRPEIINHVDISTCFCDRDEGKVWTSNCFAV
ncbi:hypothetical protein ACP70R_041436 [Stipagrostis hirtigluma subsp. patula]